MLKYSYCCDYTVSYIQQIDNDAEFLENDRPSSSGRVVCELHVTTFAPHEGSQRAAPLKVKPAPSFEETGRRSKQNPARRTKVNNKSCMNY